ncbi:MAG: hypothetical protein IK990_17835 [Ruminiclostridium sp.]|nr:hypothetical protein [Ruminiclostridium sp.]
MAIFGKNKKTGSAAETRVEIPAQNGSVAPFRLELLITIVEKNKAEFYADLIQSFECNFQFTAPAHGTAKADILHYLGLADTDKAVIFSVVREDKLDDLTYMLDNKFRTVRGGKGVAVTVPFTSMIGTSVYAFLCNAVNTVKGDE